ncbi:MarR family winged helix-turn-helix transcriptional regulator [Paraconexibacter algicola]|uniref:MarR family transcriptional regulator n=1 Tax=Paraconexibacter algicola TaxID=2133960 RepID=A0A2T4UDU0_9ACTN|nr:MarR family winged helix-turn-helix transcriptional regulator [Paraconexibacter algicola]PTL55677.1 MarR family transcriptional regulator [Paraconexibacter algicola]
MGTATTDTDLGADVDDAGRPGCLVSDLGWLLSQAHFALAHQLAVAMRDVGISPRALHVLQTARAREWNQSELAEAVGLDKTTMVSTMDELEQLGLAERRPAAHDRRARVIAVTAEGARTADRARRVVEETQAAVLAELDESQRRAFLDGLSQLVRTTLAEPAGCTPLRRRQPRA